MERVYRRWDSPNGRYLTADVGLEDGELLPDLVFDGDTAAAVELARRPIGERPELHGRRVALWLVTRDHMPSGQYGEATPEQREAFRTLKRG